jgi:hypothetical protein
MRSALSIFRAALGICASLAAGAQPFSLPTDNRAMFQTGGGPSFFVATPNGSWTSGAFGCVRSGGQQFHEGLDIRCLERGRGGEPLDAIYAVADGVVVYVNDRPALSNFGRYLLIRHEIEGLEVYSLYAHLSKVRADVTSSRPVRKGETIATMGRTSNTAQRISKERAHLHFELGFRLSDRFPAWFARSYPGKRDHHGEWNGRNYAGIDPLLVYQRQTAEGVGFSLRRLVLRQRELCRVQVRGADFSWVRRYRPLVARNPKAEQEGAAGYELVLNFAGLPSRAIPRAVSELTGEERFQLVAVNEAEATARPCRRLVVKQNGRWRLAPNGRRLLELLTF